MSSFTTKFLVIFLAASLLAACGGGDDTNQNKDQQGSVKASQAAAAVVPAPALIATWQLLPNPNYAQPTGPYVRAWTEMTWDPLRQEWVIFGGNGPDGYNNDIWSYNGATANWTVIAQQDFCPGNRGFSQPNGTDDSNFKYDPVNNLYWVFGAGSGYRCLSYATVRTAAAGSDQVTIVDPALSGSTSSTYAGWRVLIGDIDVGVQGYDESSKTLKLSAPVSALAPGTTYRLYATTGAGTWYFNPVTSTWVGQNTPAGNTGPTPSGRIAAAVDYSTTDKAFVLFAGSLGSDRTVWKLDVTTKLWTNLPVPDTGAPPHLREMLNSFVYDKQNDVFVLFGGQCSADLRCPDGMLNGETWAYRLSTNTWVNMNPPSPPGARAQQVMTYDSDNGVVVLFGGVTQNGDINDDTWIYHYPSNSWTRLFSDIKPQARYLAQIAYDSLAKRTVIFGGASLAGSRADVWGLKLTHASGLPAVSLTSPVNGSSFTGPASISLSANATDSGGSIAKVEFFAGSTKVGETLNAPFTIVWSGVSAGTYSVTAVATDNSGAFTRSSPVSVTVTPPNSPPTVDLVVPLTDNNLVAPANISLSANATDSNGNVVKVEFFAGTTKLGEALSAPFTYVWTGISAGTYSITAVATDNLGATKISAPVIYNVVSSGEAQLINVALQTNGGIATASSAYSPNHPASGVNDGVLNGKKLGSGGVWTDATYLQYPDWVQVAFSGVKTINRIDVITLPDDIAAGTDPTPDKTFSLYGITSFDVQYWTGSAWATVPGGSVTGSNLVWRTFTFPTISTDRIRVLVNGASAYGFSFIVEIQAWAASSSDTLVSPANVGPVVNLITPANGSSFTAPANINFSANATDSNGTISKVEFFAGTTKLGEALSAPFSYVWTGVSAGTYSITAVATDNFGAATISAPVIYSVATGYPSQAMNVALQTNGGVATASSVYSPNHPAAGVNDGVLNGKKLGSGGVWTDATYFQFPDWVQVAFSGVKTINRIDVITLPDDIAAGTDPTPEKTFTLYGITSFDVQYWTGTIWATVPGGSVTGNNLVWRTFSFPAVSTDRIRVLVNGASAYGFSFVVEIQAWSASSPP